MIGALGGLALILVGVGMVLYTKKLLPHETAVQDKHDGSHFDRVTAGATLVGGWHNSGLPIIIGGPGARAPGWHQRAPCASRRQIRFVTAGTSSPRRASSSSRAHCGVPVRITMPPPTP